MKLFEVLMGFETMMHHYTAMCLVRAEVDWMAVMEAEERVRFVFRLLATVPVKVARVRELDVLEAWRIGEAKGPTWARISKTELEELQNEERNLNCECE
jgi:hypothetical protein